MRNPASFRTVSVACLLVAAVGVDAEESAHGTASGPPPLPASAATATRQTPAANLRIRVYEGFGTLGPVYDHGGVPPYAVDVDVAMAVCPDGNTEISSLDIGGWQYRLGTTCQERGNRAVAGSAKVHADPKSPVPPAAAAAPESTPPHVIRCDPNTWNCAPTSR
jgi:hypothetical protein